MVVVLLVFALCAVVITAISGFVLIEWNRRENRRLILEQAEHTKSSWIEFEARHKESFERSYIDSTVGR